MRFRCVLRPLVPTLPASRVHGSAVTVLRTARNVPTFKKPRQTNRYASVFFKHQNLKDLAHLIRQNHSD